ncbi:MAG TPA: NPCBM/NEW2 domain-containing protein [Prolixibacteraceae bacterium]|nr:NPCBM/NEW2 domain-containing protein [Prolixibacteraceae bacterium]
MKKIYFLYFIILTGIYSVTAQSKIHPDSLAFQKWAQTPPMGWNSWDCYGPTVTENEVKANADYMAKYLKSSGWEYIIVDIRWYVENDKAHGYNEKDAIYVMDEYGRLQPSTLKFPSAANGKGFKALADYIHSKGLKFGIHIMRGIPVEAVKKNTAILGSNAKAQDIYSKEGQCPWLRDMYTVVADENGAQEYYNSLFALYASWGIDFVKIDDLSVPYHQKEIEIIRKAIDKTGRKIVLSTSPGETPIKNAEHVKTHANMWRIVGDFWDNWTQLKEHFEVCNRWAPYIGDGHFPDADMLPLGRIGIRAERGDNRMCALSKDEQTTMMSLFAIFRSPLMFGGNLPDNDEFTLSLLNNKDVLYVNKYSQNNHQLFRENDLIAWVADDPKTGDKFLAVFNAQDQIKIDENKALWKSGNITNSQPSQSVDFDLNISGAKKLYLAVSKAGEEFNRHHADWIEPVFYNSKDTLKINGLKWLSATSGKSNPQVNKSIANKPLTVDNKVFANGIGTYANSIIEYNIPEGYNRVKAKAGLDIDAVKQEFFGGNAEFLVYTQDPSGAMPAESSAISINLKQLGITGSCTVTDVWSKQNLGSFTNEFAPEIKRHASGLYRISVKK